MRKKLATVCRSIQTDGLPPGCLTTAEAARELGVTTARVKQLVGLGILTPLRWGRDLVFDPADVDRARSRPQKAGWPAGKKRKKST